MQNTLLIDVDLVFHTEPAKTDDDLVELDFEDLIPIEDEPDLVGVAPLEANALIPLVEYDLVGVRGFSAVAVSGAVGRPFDRRPPQRADELPTEEFTAEVHGCAAAG
ncbi:MAG: hypothetical protein H6738_11105 [Alphaproteobacteria bacterium]|nr:hypothetical protein [Alphaproteobacteria bacterium]MCB9697317.1 hypothetical protein [Alphaproteobacteria bacterium]